MAKPRGRSGGSTQPHHRVEAVEAAIERHYSTLELDEEERTRVKAALREHTEALAKVARRETTRARSEVTRLDNEERKLLQAHYADRISADLFNEEQERIKRERAAAQQLLERHQLNHDELLTVLDYALELTDRTQTAYLRAEPTERRLFNQAFFERIEVDTEEITGHSLNAPWAQLRPLLTAIPAGHKKRRSGGRKAALSTPGRVGRNPRGGGTRAAKYETPDPDEKVEGSYVNVMVEPMGIEPLTSWLPATRSPS